jgi:hypothetical protein
MTYIVICVWLVFHHLTELVLSNVQLILLQCLHQVKDWRKEVAGHSVR